MRGSSEPGPLSRWCQRQAGRRDGLPRPGRLAASRRGGFRCLAPCLTAEGGPGRELACRTALLLPAGFWFPAAPVVGPVGGSGDDRVALPRTGATGTRVAPVSGVSIPAATPSAALCGDIFPAGPATGVTGPAPPSGGGTRRVTGGVPAAGFVGVMTPASGDAALPAHTARRSSVPRPSASRPPRWSGPGRGVRRTWRCAGVVPRTSGAGLRGGR